MLQSNLPAVVPVFPQLLLGQPIEQVVLREVALPPLVLRVVALLLVLVVVRVEGEEGMEVVDTKKNFSFKVFT